MTQSPQKRNLTLMLVQEATIFGVSTGLRIYILGPFLGSWLDDRLATGSVFLLIGVLVAIVISFWRLLEALKKVDRYQKEE